MRFACLAATCVFGAAAASPVLTAQHSGTANRLQAVSPVNERVVWASGVAGTWVKTVDGGNTWQPGTVAGAENLQFRDVQGVSERVAYLLAAGPGSNSRIYKTEDGGASWVLEFQNRNPNTFYDCFAFWTPQRGFAVSDSEKGRFPAIRTLDGHAWHEIGERLPVAQTGEASFAASGSCAAIEGLRRGWIGTGGAAKARVLATQNGGEKWDAYDTPVVQGAKTAGVFTIDFRDGRHGMLGAGDLASPTAAADTTARTQDGGKTWELTPRPPFPGAVYGLSYVQSRHRHGLEDDDRYESSERRVVITGPAGAAWSPDEGGHWFSLAGASNHWAVAFANDESGWLVGTEGRIEKISFGHEHE